MLENYTPTTIDKRLRKEVVKFPEVISVTSGKGGVGKSTLSVNLSILLQQMKKKVLLIDADIHLGNIDLLLGLRSEYTIADIVNHNVQIEDAIIEGPGGIHILPASSAVSELLEMEDAALRTLADSFAKYEHNYDIVLIDTGAGISKTVTSFLLGSDKLLLIVTPDPASIADAYAVIKVMKKAKPNLPIIMISNMVKSYEEGEILFKKMNLMVQKFLVCQVEFGGSLIKDDVVSKSIKRQRPFVIDLPNTAASKGLHLLKRKVMSAAASDSDKRNNLFSNFRNNRKISLETE